MNLVVLRLNVFDLRSKSLSHDAMASMRAAIVVRNDFAVHSFNVLYRMGMPLFVPCGCYSRLLHVARPWGFYSYSKDPNKQPPPPNEPSPLPDLTPY